MGVFVFFWGIFVLGLGACTVSRLLVCWLSSLGGSEFYGFLTLALFWGLGRVGLGPWSPGPCPP